MNNEWKMPEVGQDCTLGVGSDRYPYRISRVSPSGKTFWMKQLIARRIDHNGLSESQDYIYVENPQAHEEKVFWSKANGRTTWKHGSGHVFIGRAELYQDPSF